MDGLGRTVGNGISGLVSTAFDAIGGTIRALFGLAQGALPGGVLFLVGFVIVVGLLWMWAKR
jgi:hypothetical protein